jgi:hypothetical protein
MRNAKRKVVKKVMEGGRRTSAGKRRAVSREWGSECQKTPKIFERKQSKSGFL